MQVRRLVLGALVLAGALAIPDTASAQLGDRLRRKAQEAAAKKLEEENAKRAAEKAAADSAAANASAGSNGGAASSRGGDAVWANYDFTPGSRPLFVSDLTEDQVGDFPRRLELETGNMEIVEWQGRRFLRATSQFEFRIPLAETLPERFTLEFELRTTYVAHSQSHVEIHFGNGERADFAMCGRASAGIYAAGGFQAKAVSDFRERHAPGTAVRCRLMVDGKYAKMYVNETRVANHPNTSLGRSRAITIKGFVNDPHEIMIGDLRVAAGGRKLYDALADSGRVSTQGILFNTGSDVIRPESTPTLKEIAQMLTDHPDLRIVIEGHTDNAGDAKANLALSEKRAAAVKAYLVSRHGITADRLATKGFGASKPTVANGTAEGRQQNRRVELVKQP